MRLVTLVLAAASTLAFAPRLLVHATLISSEPAANARLASAPSRIRLVFNEPVEGKLGKITLVPGSGSAIMLRTGADPRDVHAVIAPVDSLAAGSYRVDWRVISADGHPVDGTFVFSVGDTTLGAQAAQPPPPPPPDQEAEEEPDVWGPAAFGAPIIPAILRGLALGSLLAAAGMLLFYVGAGPNAAQFGDRRVKSVTTMFTVAAPVLIGAHLLAWLINTAPDHTFDTTWFASALGTSVGKIELARFVLAVLALWGWWLARRPRVALNCAVLSIIASGASGHSAAIQPIWGIPSKTIHLLASAVWLGGLLWLLVRPASDDVNTFAHDADRVSSRALWAVIAVAFTGIVQTRLFLASWIGLVTSPYGILVLSKSTGLLVLVAFGAYNRQRLVPRLAAAARAATDVAALRSSVTKEIVIMWLVILLGGLLAYVPPPAEHAMMDMSSHSTTS
jgi:copper transport protein